MKGTGYLLPDTLIREISARTPRDYQQLLEQLLGTHLVLDEEWERLAETHRQHILRSGSDSEFFDRLTEHGLLNQYQADRLEAGKAFGMILGNYRVLERIGAGGMGVVFRAEHIRLRRQVAIKVLPLDADKPRTLLGRFYSEIRAVGQLVHPNIVAAIDTGEVLNPDPDGPTLHYFVMEYVPGQDLEQYVQETGPLAAGIACDITRQIASALGESNSHHIVHRDIKPSNILLTPEGQAKLLDFGLTRSIDNRLTEPGVVIGTVEFMAPEQVRDATAVDIRADIYALGGTLFWCLAGRPPFPPGRNLIESLTQRLTLAPPSIRSVRPDVPAAVDEIIRKMMAMEPEDRYQTPEEVAQALVPWLTTTGLSSTVGSVHGVPVRHCLPQAAGDQREKSTLVIPDRASRVLVVDDEAAPRELCVTVLRAAGIECAEAAGGEEALRKLHAAPFDLVLLDVNMPDLSGLEVCRRLRENPPCKHLKIITISGLATPDDLAQMLMTGADDFLSKPFSVVQLMGRVKAALRLKSAQDRTDSLNRHLLSVNEQLQVSLDRKDSSLVDTRNALVLTLAMMVQEREGSGTSRLTRLQLYTRRLAEEAARLRCFEFDLDQRFIDLLAATAPLLDIGKVGLPDHILLKPGQLSPDERIIMQAHTIIGGDLLDTVCKQYSSAHEFLRMAKEITRHHHERHDGKGYPDALSGDDIPVSARLVSPCDVYDALRSRRPYRPGLSHTAACQVLQSEWGGQLDPRLRPVFESCAGDFDRIFREHS